MVNLNEDNEEPDYLDDIPFYRLYGDLSWVRRIEKEQGF